jgi:hypothetical protein
MPNPENAIVLLCAPSEIACDVLNFGVTAVLTGIVTLAVETAPDVLVTRAVNVTGPVDPAANPMLEELAPTMMLAFVADQL